MCEMMILYERQKYPQNQVGVIFIPSTLIVDLLLEVISNVLQVLVHCTGRLKIAVE